MHSKNLFTPANIGQADYYATVKTAGAQQCGIENVRTVRRRHQDDAFVRFEAVHLDQQLIQSLFALIVSAAKTSAAVTSDRINFVDEDNARRVLLALLKQIAYAAGAHANKHFDKVRARNREEGNVRFASNRAGQQSLTRSRAADQQHALGNTSAELLELLRFAQELDDFFQFFFGFIHASHVFERDLLLLHGEQARPALAERKRLIATHLHLANHEEPERRQQNERGQCR